MGGTEGLVGGDMENKGYLEDEPESLAINRIIKDGEAF